MKLGPVSLAFARNGHDAGEVDQAKRIVLAAKGMEQKGKGPPTPR